MKKTLYLIGMTLIIAGCVVVTPPPIFISSPNHHVIHVDYTYPTTIEDGSVTPCEAFLLPSIKPLPEVPDLTSDRYRTFKDVERALGEHILELRQYIHTNQQLLFNEYNDYLVRCELTQLNTR